MHEVLMGKAEDSFGKGAHAAINYLSSDLSCMSYKIWLVICDNSCEDVAGLLYLTSRAIFQLVLVFGNHLMSGHPRIILSLDHLILG